MEHNWIAHIWQLSLWNCLFHTLSPIPFLKQTFDYTFSEIDNFFFFHFVYSIKILFCFWVIVIFSLNTHTMSTIVSNWLISLMVKTAGYLGLFVYFIVALRSFPACCLSPNSNKDSIVSPCSFLFFGFYIPKCLFEVLPAIFWDLFYVLYVSSHVLFCIQQYFQLFTDSLFLVLECTTISSFMA